MCNFVVPQGIQCCCDHKDATQNSPNKRDNSERAEIKSMKKSMRTRIV